MMTFTLQLTPLQLSELTKSLSRLATDTKYETTTNTLSIDNFDPADEARIVELVASMTKTADLPQADEVIAIDYVELAREAARAKRAAALQDKAAWARLRAKRQRQVAFEVGL